MQKTDTERNKAFLIKIMMMLLLAFLLVFHKSTPWASNTEKPHRRIGTAKRGMKDGDYRKAEFNEPYSAVEYSGKIYITDSGNHCIRLFDRKEKKVRTVTGKSYKTAETRRGYQDGALNIAMFCEPRGITVDKKGVLYIADTGNHAIRKIEKGKVYTVAGGKKAGNKDGKAKAAEFNRPHDVATDGENLYVADSLNSCIRKIDRQGNVSTLIKDKRLIEPTGLYVDRKVLYITDSGAQQIFKYELSKGGKLSVVAGASKAKDKQTGYRKWGYKDGEWNKAEFNFPKSTAVYKKVLYVADTWNSCIRKLNNKKVGTFLKLKEVSFESRPTKLLFLDKEILVVDSANSMLLFYKK